MKIIVCQILTTQQQYILLFIGNNFTQIKIYYIYCYRMLKRQENTQTKASLLQGSCESSDINTLDPPTFQSSGSSALKLWLKNQQLRPTSLKKKSHGIMMLDMMNEDKFIIFGNNQYCKTPKVSSYNLQKKLNPVHSFSTISINTSEKTNKKSKDYFREYFEKKTREMEIRKSQIINSQQKQYAYEILKPIGEGKFAKVYLAKHKRTGFIGAMKIIRKDILKQFPAEKKIEIIAQMIREIKIHSYLQHPNIIQLYDCFHDQHYIYLFLELATDGQLYQMLSKAGKFSEETTSLVVRQIAQGLHYIHSQDVIHRDIKLENIVFTHGMAKICDFGWSVYAPKNFRTTLCGTPLYLSPQILKGKSYNLKVDVWALGAMTYELISGQNPFGIKQSRDLSNIIDKEVLINMGSPEVRSFVNFILRKNPQKRPYAQTLLKHPFLLKYQDLQTSEQLCTQVYCH